MTAATQTMPLQIKTENRNETRQRPGRSGAEERRQGKINGEKKGKKIPRPNMNGAD